ncbi:MAG: YigZ family protein [Planctomycetota bacterium]
MTDEDRLQSVADGPEVELREKGSLFVGQAWCASREAEAATALERTRTRYPDATHHCWALRIGDAESLRERSDDAGEPGGTAGQPILGAIQRAMLTDVLIVVTRYFGGTKLGKGGLVRAYGEAARLALAAAPARTIWREAAIAIRCDYADVGAVEAAIARAGEAVRAVRRDFSQQPTFDVTVRASAARRLIDAVSDATRGRAEAGIREHPRPGT